MRTVISKDGTGIAYDQSGQGLTVILVDGALQYRAFDQGMVLLAELLSPHFNVIHYDRRGRGDSTDMQPDAVEREIEDIEALIYISGGTASLYGISSGAALAMEAAIALDGRIRKLAMYEPPYNNDESARQTWKAYTTKLEKLLAEGRKGDAVGLFMMYVGLPEDQLEGMRQHPMWPLWEEVGQTLSYDHTAILGEEASIPVERAARVNIPTLIINGSDSFPFVYETAKILTEAMPDAQHQTLQGQTHEVSSETLAPVLIEFFRL